MVNKNIVNLVLSFPNLDEVQAAIKEKQAEKAAKKSK